MHGYSASHFSHIRTIFLTIEADQLQLLMNEYMNK